MCLEPASEYTLPVIDQKNVIADDCDRSRGKYNRSGSGSAGISLSLRCCAFVGLFGIVCSNDISLAIAFLLCLCFRDSRHSVQAKKISCDFPQTFKSSVFLQYRHSWHSIQKNPCEVLAYLRFSSFFLHFRHLKHVSQKTRSPVRMARSSILLLQTLQLYVQLLQMSDPSPRIRRFESESRFVPQVLQRKQFKCHRLPAGKLLAYQSRRVIML